MCSELKLSIETFCLFHKSGLRNDSCFPEAVPVSLGWEGKGMDSQELLAYLGMGSLPALAAPENPENPQNPDTNPSFSG